ncbi:uncharacterized protein BDR25DRAFT_28736 [Lindgomyces ingoldianus]|uniref:Uncharacterized protein n=1 Tax=Lindgomyces ingoldianus TaxID=673940 RepID=A0ACB6QVF1_9PLEO|nr:uncharacterized protein BDR25DRAFT_28736 [Lindgomyces ingoldianus]KAF2470983.1 hypothetical protein BDR25DRAFT_28736 [Lindgomyces ingoldianus]
MVDLNWDSSYGLLTEGVRVSRFYSMLPEPNILSVPNFFWGFSLNLYFLRHGRCIAVFCQSLGKGSCIHIPTGSRSIIRDSIWFRSASGALD